jgi:hypothetical protein
MGPFGKGRPTQTDIEARLQKAELNRAKSGHTLNPFQKALLVSVYEIDPETNSDTAKEFAAVEKALADKKTWVEQDEWRISTWIERRIDEVIAPTGVRYQARVECDGQVFSCVCPSPYKAYVFCRLYSRIIIDGFYSLGPPWV